jgi:hypothetical protein
VFLLGVAMLAISTPVLLLHLRPKSSFAIAASEGSPEQPNAIVEASPAVLSIERFATAATLVGADSVPILAEPPAELPAVSGRKVTAKGRPARIGTLVLQVTPWANVVIDGKNQGEVTGVRRFKLRAGTHRLQFKHPRASEERTISLASNQELHQAYRVFGP